MSGPTKISPLLNARFAQRGNRVEDQADKAAKGMEKIFVKFLLDEMRKTESKADVFGATKNDFFEDSLYEEYANLISERGDLGLSKEIKAQILKSRNGRR